MATLSTIDEELSSVHAESIDEEETQIVPETQFENDYDEDLDFNDRENDDRPAISDRDSMTPGTKTMLDAYRPSSSKGLALAAEDFTFQLSRPKSSGEDSVTGDFIFAKHEIPKMNFQHGKRQKSPPPEAQKQQDANEYREEKLQAVKVPIKPSHIQEEIQAETVADQHRHSREAEDVAPVLDTVNRLPMGTKKSSGTKSGGKRSKEKTRASKKTGRPIEQYQNPVQLHETEINHTDTWPEDQQSPLQDSAGQPIDEQSWQKEHGKQDTKQPDRKSRWQQQNEVQPIERGQQEQQTTFHPFDERHWQQENVSQPDNRHWQEQQNKDRAVSHSSWQQHHTESQPLDEQQWQERHRAIAAVNNHSCQQQNQVPLRHEPMLHQDSMDENSQETGDAQEEMRQQRRSTERQQPGFQGNNNKANYEHHAARDNDAKPMQHYSAPSIHGNFVQLTPIATGIKGVTKKKKKKTKKKKLRSTPALDVSTLPEVIFGIPFDQLPQVPATGLRLHQDQQQGPLPQLSDTPVAHNEYTRVSGVATKMSGQYVSSVPMEAAVATMDVDQQDQRLGEEQALTRAADNEFAEDQSASYPFPRQPGDLRQGTEAGSRQSEPDQQLLSQVAASSEHSKEHHAVGPQEARHHHNASIECLNDSDSCTPRHEQPVEPSDLNNSVRQEHGPQKFGQDSQTVSHLRSGKHQALRGAEPDKSPHTNGHVPQNLHVQQEHHELSAQLDEPQSVMETQYGASLRRQPSGSRVNSVDSRLVLPGDRDLHLVQASRRQGQPQSHIESSHSAQEHPVAINAQSAIHRQGASMSGGRTTSILGRSSKHQITSPVTEQTLPVIDVPVQLTPATEASSAQVDPLSGAIQVLQLTIQQNLQATVAKEDEARRALQDKIVQLKISEARLQAEVYTVTATKAELMEKSKNDREMLRANSERLTKRQKFIDGLNNDMAKEKQNVKALHQQITELLKEGKTSATELTQVGKQLNKATETSKAVQSKLAAELTDAKLSLQKFELEKAFLEKELCEKNQLLEDERNQRLRLADDVRCHTIDQQLMKQLINETSVSLLQSMSELQLTVGDTKDILTSQGATDMLHLGKALESRNLVCPDDFAGLKESVEIFQNSMISRMGKLQIISNSDSRENAINANAALDLEKKLSEQLVSLKAEIISNQSLQTQLAELREIKATSDERSDAKDRQINDLIEQLGRLQEDKGSLIEKLNQAEAQIFGHTSGSSGEEFESIKQEMEEARRKLEVGDETQTILRIELETLQESIRAKESQINDLIKHKSEAERKAEERMTLMRGQLTKQAQQLRQEQQAEFDNRLHQLNQKCQQAVAALKQAESSSAGHASAIEAIKKNHAAALDALRRDHESAIEITRKSNAAALENQSCFLLEESRKKVDAQRRDLNDKADREKDELHGRIATADTETESAHRSLEKARQEAEEIIKKQTEKTRSDLNDLRSRLRAEAQQESDKLIRSHEKEQDALQKRTTQAETELESLKNTLKAQLAKPSLQPQLSQSLRPSQSSQSKVQPIVSSAEPSSTPFKKPRRKLDRRELARPSPHSFLDDGVSFQNAAPPTLGGQWPRIRTFAEIDSMISENFEIFEDPDTSSELTDVPSSLPAEPGVLRELPVANPRGNAHSGTASSNGSVSEPFFGPARPRSSERASANSAMRVTGGSTLANSSETATRVAETQRQSLPALEDLPSEFGDSQSQPRRTSFAAGKENRPPVNGASKLGQGATRSAHFQTPKTRERRSTHEPTQSSTPDYLERSQSRHSPTKTTYAQSKQAKRPSSGLQSQPAARNEPSSSAKRRRNTNAVEDTAAKKRSKTAKAQSVPQFETPETQPQHLEPQRVAETQLQHSKSDSQHSQALPRATALPIAMNHMLPLPSASSRPTSQSRLSSAEHATLSRARTSNTSTKKGATSTSTTDTTCGKGRRVSGRSSASRYDLRFSQELDR